MIDTVKICKVLHYLLSKIGQSDKIKLVKLVYLADKYHLLKYGRSITNDEYYAMAHGPVGSTVKDILELDKDFLSKGEYICASGLIERHKEGKTYVFKPKNDTLKMDYGYLSDSDKEALDLIVEHFGKKSSWELRQYTHKYPEWKQYKDLFATQSTRRERIPPQELLTMLPDDPFNLSEKHIEESRNILLGLD